MTQFTHRFALILGLAVLTAVPSYAACNSSEEEAPVRFGFKDSQYQKDWIYQSLRPYVETGTSIVFPYDSTVQGAELDLTFCLAKGSQGQLTFHFGPRQLTTTKRPVGTDGRDAPILFLLEPGPDWLIVSDPTWETTTDGAPLITFNLYNANAAREENGPMVNLLLSQASGACFGASGTEEVPVRVFISNKSITTVAKDSGFTDQVQRSAHVDDSGCNFRALLPLATTNGVAPGDTLIVRFKLSGKTDVFRRSDGSKTDLYSFQEVPERVLRFEGQNVFPHCLEVKLAGYRAIFSQADVDRFCAVFP